MFTGIDSPYEEPINADLTISTENNSIDVCVNFIYKNLEL
jgi:adenylylsulfate kinase-like enzyme